MRNQLGHWHADARDIRRKVVHVEEALVEEDEPLVRVDHAQAMRHAGERRLVQRKQFPELTRLISLNGVGHVHNGGWLPPERASYAGGRNRRLIGLVYIV